MTTGFCGTQAQAVDSANVSDLAEHIRKEATTNGLTNTLFNGVIAWLLLKGGDDLGWTGHGNFVIDVVATAFILPFIVALIIVPLQRRKLRLGKLSPVALDRENALQAMVGRFPASLFLAALLFGLLGMLVFVPAALLPFWALGIEQIAPNSYAVFKGVWAGVMAAVLAVPMIFYALRKA